MSERVVNGVFWLLLGLFSAVLVASLTKGALLLTAPVKSGVPVPPRNTPKSNPSPGPGDIRQPDLAPVDSLRLVRRREAKADEDESPSGGTLRSLSGDSIQKIQESQLPFELVGTSSGSKTHRFALVRSLESKRVRKLRPGEDWQSLRLEKVEEEWVQILNRERGSVERLILRRSHRSTLSTPAKNRHVKQVSRYQINQAIHSNMNNLLASVDARPVLKNGGVAGFRIENMRGRPGALLKKLGFREGDVIRRVNGREMNSMDRAMQLWTQLRNKKRFRIEVLRDGEVLTLAYSLVR